MEIRNLLRPLIFRIIKPLLWRYLSRERGYRYRDIRMIIRPGVFHPGFFFSTRLLLDFLERQDLAGKALLELGAGSGLIAIRSARRGARVTASDINPDAVQSIRENAAANNTELTVIESDLFANIPRQRFDYIIINPPYYPQNPASKSEYAWFCGAEFEYFQNLFPQLGDYFDGQSQALMILSEDCRIETIREIAAASGMHLREMFRKRVWGEWNFIFKIERP